MKEGALEAISLFQRAGREVEGGEAFAKELWVKALQRYSNAQINKGAQLVLERISFRTIRPAHIVQMIESETFQGAGKASELDSAKAVFWKDEQGRDMVYHPGISGTYPRQS